jgi:hypothetical protein
MPRAMSPEKLKEYIELEKYLHNFATCIWKIPEDADFHPTKVGRRILEAHGLRSALSGLRQAVNDTLETIDDWDQELVQKLDALLRAEGIVTVSELRRRSSRHLGRIVKRGKIRTETEYYLVKGIVDGCAETLGDDEVDMLNKLMAGYEARIPSTQA